MKETTEGFKLKLVVEVTAAAPDVHAAKAALASHGRAVDMKGGGVDITVESVHVSEKKTRKKVVVDEA